LTAGVASNAVAISNDADCERAAKILGAATAIHDQLRNALRERIQSRNTRKKASAKKDELDSVLPPALKRGFLGLPPIPSGDNDDSECPVERLDKQGSVVKLVARPDSSHTSSRSSVAVDRTRSLLRLARQIRSESGTSSDRRRSSDVIIRHLGRGLAIDHLDEEHDLIGLLEGGSVLDSSEPLSRVIASVQSRRRTDSGISGTQSRHVDEGGSGAPSRKGESWKEVLEDCQRLHMLMREAERETYELSRRVQAWKRLDNGELAETNALITEPVSYSPSHCSACGAAVALQLLVLWMRLFLARPSDVYVDRDFLNLLLEEVPGVSKGLSDCKRQVVREIATKSHEGARLVLAELRKRLSATNDNTSAEILGKIMEVEGFCMSEEYSKLAMEVLTARQGFNS
jgi:hypothetical protein